MTKTCFNLRYFNLPQTALDVLRRVANSNNEICGGDGEETDVYLPYSGPFFDLSVTDYLKVQSDYRAKQLIRKLHSPDQVRFAKQGLSFYISDPQKRRDFVAAVENDERFPQVDALECYWKESFTLPHLRWDETLMREVWNSNNFVSIRSCSTSGDLIRKSFAHYYGFSDAQVENLPFHVDAHDIDALMHDGLRSPEATIRLILKDGVMSVRLRFKLSKYGISDAASLAKSRDLYFNWPEQCVEPLVMELLRLGVSDPLAILGDRNISIKTLFQVLSRMRDSGYTDDEMRWMVTHFPQINIPRIFGRSWLEGLTDIFPRARKEGVSFKEIRWILEDSVGGCLSEYFDAQIWEIFRAYCHQPHRTREAVYGLYQDYPRTMALALEPGDAESFWERLRHYDSGMINSFANIFARRMGIGGKVARSLLESGSSLLWEFVFKHRAEAYIFDPQKMEDYRAIAKDLHNRGTDEGVFFSHVSFDYVAPPKSVQEAAQMVHHLQTIDARANGWGLAYLARAVVPRWPQLQKNYRAWQNPKTGRLDVTRHTIKQVNQLLALFAPFPFYTGNQKAPSEHLSVAAEGQWIAHHLDVEEIDVRHLSVELYADYFELIKRLQDLSATASSRYLSKQMLDMEAKKIFAGDMLNIAKIEGIRQKSNASYPHLGDRLVDNLGIAMLEEVASSVFTIASLQRIARAWGLVDNGNVARDVRGLYQQYSHFAYQMISDVIMDKTDNWRDTDRIKNLKTFLAEKEIDLEALVNELEAAGFPIRTESDWDKFKNRMTSDPGYVFRRAAQKTLPEVLLATNMSGLTVKPAMDWAVRKGVTVQVIANEKGAEIARAIQCDRSVVGAEFLINNDAHVDTEARKQALGAKYVFSAPLNMTTPDTRTMTEIAYDRGEPMNWLMSARGKDGLLLVDPNHSPKILDKRAIALHQMIDAADVQKKEMAEALDIWRRRRKLPEMPPETMLSQVIQPFTQFADKLLFRVIMAQKSYSLLSGMLFTAGSDSHRLKTESGTASRRLFVEYADGKFGVVDGTEYLTTEETFEAAKAAGATRAIYMDTGMWDRADYVDGKGEAHRLDQGLSNSSASTNRVIIRVK